MNTKILKLANALYNNEECKNSEFSLTINYKELIKKTGKYKIHEGKHGFQEHIGWDIPYLNEEGLKKIEDELTKVKVENFNLTVKFDKGQKIDKDGEFNYDIDWYSCQFIFFGKSNIQMIFDMLSNYSHFSQSDYNRVLGDIIVDENEICDTIKKIVNLKNILIDNGHRLLDTLSQIKYLKY
jgi:hypothetical protein